MIAAIVLAAGLSHRMGRFKLTLPWGETTVVGQVVATLAAADLAQIVVVTGHRAAEVEAALAGTRARPAHNPAYATGEMLSSIQAGLRALQQGTLTPARLSPAALLGLGDQPQMEAATVRAVLAAGAKDDWQRIVIPSYRMRAGHPILLPAWLWPEILDCASTLRDVMALHRERTHYLDVDTPTVLADLDTPEDYAAGRQRLVDRRQGNYG
jgi:molybdenum cofactor cytidylyltransferase